jgi:DNA-binding MarR family transcriptional regulator
MGKGQINYKSYVRVILMKKYEKIIENFIFIGPTVAKALLKYMKESFPKAISRSHFEVMFTLKNHGSRSMTDLCNILATSKPYMTSVIDRLIKEGYVSRITDDHDRRVIKIDLTKKGNELLELLITKSYEGMSASLDQLSDKDLKNLGEYMEKIKSILSRILDLGKENCCQERK